MIRLGLTLLLLFGPGLYSGPQTASAQEINGLAAVVNGEVITLGEVRAAVQTQAQVWFLSNPNATQEEMLAKRDELEKRALDDLIDNKLILSEFKQKGGHIKDVIIDQEVKNFIRERFAGDEAAFYDQLKAAGLTTGQFREMQKESLIIRAVSGQNYGPRVIVNSPTELREAYDRYKSDFAEESLIQLKMLSVPKAGGSGPESQKALIEEIRQKILDGADFSAMARTYSKDSFSDDGGNVGTIDRTELSPDLSNVAFSLPTRQVSKVVDQGGFWRLLFVEGRRGGNVPSFDDLREQVDKLLKEEKRRGYRERWLTRLRRDADIRIYQ